MVSAIGAARTWDDVHALYGEEEKLADALLLFSWLRLVLNVPQLILARQTSSFWAAPQDAPLDSPFFLGKAAVVCRPVPFSTEGGV